MHLLLFFFSYDHKPMNLIYSEKLGSTMSSMWNSKRAILKDLSLAQGCEVPTDLESTITAGEKPPALNIVEEDEYFHHCFGDYQPADGNTTPDCGLILQMLELVQSKPMSENHVTKETVNDFEICQERNHIGSLTTKNNATDSKQNSILLYKEPSSMFRKKKSTSSKNAASDVNNKAKTTSPPINVASINTYQPSTLAEEYCQQFMERSKIRDSIKDDVWSKAIRVMNEIDSKKKLEADTLTTFDAIDLSEDKGNTSQTASRELPGTSIQSFTNYDVVHLPQHRHLLTGKCIVCEIFKKHGIDIEVGVKFDKFVLSPRQMSQDGGASAEICPPQISHDGGASDEICPPQISHDGGASDEICPPLIS